MSDANGMPSWSSVRPFGTSNNRSAMRWRGLVWGPPVSANCQSPTLWFHARSDDYMAIAAPVGVVYTSRAFWRECFLHIRDAAISGANERIHVAVIGIRNQGTVHLNNWCGLKDSHNVQVKTVCDTDEQLFAPAVKLVEQKTGAKPGTRAGPSSVRIGNCGSIGPSAECFPIKMRFAAQAIIVAADIAACGTIARTSVNLVRR